METTRVAYEHIAGLKEEGFERNFAAFYSFECLFFGQSMAAARHLEWAIYEPDVCKREVDGDECGRVW